MTVRPSTGRAVAGANDAGDGFRDHALELAQAGWEVFPLAGKIPRTPHGVLDASSDPEQIRKWWGAGERWNIGAAVPDCLVVVDEDPRNGSTDTMAELVETHGELPETLTVLTGGGGRHRYFLNPGGKLRSGGNALGPGVDLLKAGKYTVVPPSVHPGTGHPYRWVDVEVPPAPLPAWVVARLRPPEPRPVPIRRLGSADAYVDAAVEGECRAVATTAQGGRNDALNRASFKLGTLVGAGRLDANVAFLSLLNAAIAAGLGETEASRTIRSGLEAGARTPRGAA